jgi:hypothetical protein
MMMQYFLARFRLYDGMHEYGGAFIVRAVTLEEAHTLATAQEHEPELSDKPAELTYWDCGHGETGSEVESMISLTPQEARLVERLGLAYRL